MNMLWLFPPQIEGTIKCLVFPFRHWIWKESKNIFFKWNIRYEEDSSECMDNNEYSSIKEIKDEILDPVVQN